MPFELQIVVWTTVILFVLILIQGSLVPLNQGFGWGLGSRDAAQDTTVLQGRSTRTISNHVQGMLIFVPLALVAVLADLSSGLTVLGAGLYLAGRIAYAPLYLLGVPYLRSLAWAVSLTGILLIGYEVISAALAG